MPTAENIITDIRDLIGDPVYDASGVPQPAADGQFLRAQTIVRWINQAQALLGQALKGIEDWTAFPGVLNQEIYSIDPRFFNLESGTLQYDGWITTGPPILGEVDTIPLQNLMTGTSLSWSISRTSPPMRIRLWPAPDRTPGSGFLATNIGPDDTSIQVVDITPFGTPNSPNYGWLRINHSELVRYQSINLLTNTFSLVTRGEGGTKRASHNSGTYIEEANIWLKGVRLPTPVGLPISNTVGSQQAAPVLSDSGWAPGSFSLSLTDQLEIPDYYTHLIVEWCLRRARIKENDQQAGDALLKNFADSMAVVNRAHRRQRIGQARPFGGNGAGLFWGRIIVR